MSTALDNVELRIGGINDAQMNNALKEQKRDSLLGKRKDICYKCKTRYCFI